MQNKDVEVNAGQTNNKSTTEESAGISKDVCNMALLAHLLGLLTGFLGPLILWLVKKDEDPFIKEHSRMALNWQISYIIYVFISSLLCMIFIGFLILPVFVVLNIVFTISGMIAASKGKDYKYKFSFNLIK